MTKKLEQLFDLKRDEDTEDSIDITKSLMDEAKVISESLSTTEKLDLALTTVTGLNEHDSEMDDIASKALNTYQDLINLGLSVTENNAGEIFGVAAQMLKTALDARDAKVSRKLKTIDLMLKKQKLEHDRLSKGADPLSPDSPNGSETGGVFDRNEIIRLLKERSVNIEPTESKNDQDDDTESSDDASS